LSATADELIDGPEVLLAALSHKARMITRSIIDRSLGLIFLPIDDSQPQYEKEQAPEAKPFSGALFTAEALCCEESTCSAGPAVGNRAAMGKLSTRQWLLVYVIFALAVTCLGRAVALVSPESEPIGEVQF
jgi:hypothetical protein